MVTALSFVKTKVTCSDLLILCDGKNEGTFSTEQGPLDTSSLAQPAWERTRLSSGLPAIASRQSTTGEH